MNIALNPGQSNTKQGVIKLPGYVDLSGKENYLLKLINDSGTTKFALPTGVTDLALFICGSGDVAGNDSSAEAPGLDGNARVLATGTGNAGEVLVLDSGAYGKVKTMPASAGLYFSPGVAEEAWVAGQLVKFRPLPRLVSVKPTQTSATVTTAAATDLATSEALANALKTAVNALIVDVAAIIADEV